MTICIKESHINNRLQQNNEMHIHKKALDCVNLFLWFSKQHQQTHILSMILTLKETGLSCCSALDPLYRGQVRMREAQECWVVLGSHELENGHLWLEVSGGVIHRVLEKQRSCAEETDQIHLSGKREEHWDEEGSELYSREDSESCTTFSLPRSLSLHCRSSQ